MDFRLYTSTSETLSFSGTVPPSLAAFVIEGCDNRCAVGDSGSVVVSETGFGPFRLRCINFIIKKAGSFHYQSLAPGFHTVYALRGGWQYNTGRQQDIMLPKGQFNLFYTPPTDHLLRFAQLRTYSLLDITYSRDYLYEFAPHYILLQDFLQRVDNRVSAAPDKISPINAGMGLEIKTLVRDLLEQDFSGAEKQLAASRLTTLLLQSLDRITANRLDPVSGLLPPYDMDKIQEAGEYLLENLDTPFTLVELARKIGINDYKLKRGFKKFFDMTVFEFLIRARMEKARQLLLETELPIQEISMILGYRSIANFSAAFKKYMGCPPSKLKTQMDAN